MKKYLDPENDRYRYYVRECVNGFAIQVLVVPSGDNIPLSPQVAAQQQIALPDGYRIQSSTLEASEAELDRLAALNGWTPIE